MLHRHPIASLFVTAAAVVLIASQAWSQERLDAPTAEQLVDALTQPLATPQHGASRSMAAAPDPATHLCVASEKALIEGKGAPGEPSRGLYRVDAPKVDLNVRFELNSTRLTLEAEQLLGALGTALNSPQLAQARFVIAGHTDRSGADPHNRRLSCGRALAVRDYLQRKRGVARTRLVTMGFGSDSLLLPDQPTDEVNRRVEVRKL